MDNSSSVRMAIRDGNMLDMLTALEPDEREDFILVSPYASQPETGTLTLARVGQTVFMIEPDGDITIAVHDHEGEETTDAECFRGNVEAIRARVERANVVARTLRGNARLQQALEEGMPPGMAAAMLAQEARQQQASQQRDLPPVNVIPAPVMDTGPTGGFYL